MSTDRLRRLLCAASAAVFLAATVQPAVAQVEGGTSASSPAQWPRAAQAGPFADDLEDTLLPATTPSPPAAATESSNSGHAAASAGYGEQRLQRLPHGQAPTQAFSTGYYQSASRPAYPPPPWSYAPYPPGYAIYRTQVAGEPPASAAHVLEGWKLSGPGPNAALNATPGSQGGFSYPGVTVQPGSPYYPPVIIIQQATPPAAQGAGIGGQQAGAANNQQQQSGGDGNTQAGQQQTSQPQGFKGMLLNTLFGMGSMLGGPYGNGMSVARPLLEGLLNGL